MNKIKLLTMLVVFCLCWSNSSIESEMNLNGNSELQLQGIKTMLDQHQQLFEQTVKNDQLQKQITIMENQEFQLKHQKFLDWKNECLARASHKNTNFTKFRENLKSKTSTERNCWIEGTLTDDFGNALSSVEISAFIYDDSDIPYTVAQTDENGYYILDLYEGYWNVVIDAEQLLPDFLVPLDLIEQFIADGETLTHDLMAYSTDSFISGNVYFDDEPFESITVFAGHELGLSEAISQPDGTFQLPVASALDELGGYYIYIDTENLPDNIVSPDHYHEIISNTEGIDFNLQTADGTISGYVYDVDTNETIEDAFVIAQNHSFYFTNFSYSGNDGYYEIPVLNGEHEVSVIKDGYYNEDISDISIFDNSIQLDFYLVSFEITGALEGFVYDESSGAPVDEAYVFISNYPNDNGYYNGMNTDENGYYYFDLPNGVFEVHAQKDGYIQSLDVEVTILNNVVQQDLVLPEPDGLIFGHVYNSLTNEPIPDVSISAYNPEIGIPFGATTDNYGIFEIQVLNGTYNIICFEEGYYNQFLDTIEIQDNEVQYDIYLEPIIFTGAIYGYVYENETNNPMASAEITVGGVMGDPYYSNNTFTNADGYYYLESPNGTFSAYAKFEGLLPSNRFEFNIENNEIQLDFTLQEPTGSIQGYVIDIITGISIENVLVGAGTMESDWLNNSISDTDGYYEIPVMNGSFFLGIVTQNYLPFFFFNINIDNDIYILDIYLIPLIIPQKGDINNDLALDILDVVILVDFVLGFDEPTDYEFWASDLQEDEVIDILDVVWLVQLILEN